MGGFRKIGFNGKGRHVDLESNKKLTKYKKERNVVKAEDILDKLVVREISVINSNGQEIINIGGLRETEESSVEKNDNCPGAIKIYNENGVMVASVGSDQEGDGVIETFNGAGVMSISMWCGIDSGGSIFTYNNKGDLRVAIGWETEGKHGVVNVYDKYGENWASYFHYK